jgi:SAM-dependent methyltransferase
MASREEMSRSFGRRAGVYDAGRPDYPAEAVEWMLELHVSREHAVRVADVGAGTGKLTRALVEAGAEVVAIDPDPEMLAVLRESVHAVPTFVGSAESLPLPDAAVDVVTFGQAWHWVDPVVASREVTRVLRPRGGLGLVWNIRDDDIEWVRRLTSVMHGSHAEQMLAEGPPTVGVEFGPVESAEWRWTRAMTREALFDMAHSRSYIITASDADRARIEADLGELFDEVGAVGDATVGLPYVTRAFRALRV